MASIKPMTGKDGKVHSYKIRSCVGRDPQTYKQIWRTTTFPRPEGLTPKREEKTVKELAEAWEKEQKEEYERTQEKTPRRKTLTFSSFVKSVWLPDHVDDPSSHTPSTISFYHYMAQDLVDYFGDKVLLSAVDAEQVKRYVKWCNNEALTKKGTPYSASSTKHHYNTLRSILGYAARFNYIKENPTKRLTKSDKPKKVKRHIDFLSPPEAKRFLECLEGEPLFWRCMMHVLIFTGLRRGEAVALQWQDIDRDNMTIRVERNVTVDRNSPDKYHVGSTKTDEERIVPITQNVLLLLDQLRKEQESLHGVTFPRAFIFCRATDPYAPIYPTEPTRWQRKFTERHNLPQVSPHDLRHTAATLAMAAGANAKEVQILLGHSDVETTLGFYTGVLKEAERRTVQGIENLLNDAQKQ